MTKEQTPKEKGYEYIDNNQNDDFLIDITLAKMGVNIALSEQQKQHEAKLKEIRDKVTLMIYTLQERQRATYNLLVESFIFELQQLDKLVRK